MLMNYSATFLGIRNTINPNLISYSISEWKFFGKLSRIPYTVYGFGVWGCIFSISRFDSILGMPTNWQSTNLLNFSNIIVIVNSNWQLESPRESFAVWAWADYWTNWTFITLHIFHDDWRSLEVHQFETIERNQRLDKIIIIVQLTDIFTIIRSVRKLIDAVCYHSIARLQSKCELQCEAMQKENTQQSNIQLASCGRVVIIQKLNRMLSISGSMQFFSIAFGVRSLN